MSSDLKPCPFCGGKRLGMHIWPVDNGPLLDIENNYCVQCMECNTEGPDTATIEDARAAWNRREGRDE